MNRKACLALFILGIFIFSGCADSKKTTSESQVLYKEIIGYMTYIDRVEDNGQRTILVIVSPTATKQQVKDLADFIINEAKENKIWLEVWDDLETLQKGSVITSEDKIAHYIMYAVVDKSTDKKDYYWQRQ